MKTMMILALILLVAVGIWNSPPRVTGVVYVTASDLEPYMDESGDITIDTETLVPMAKYTEGHAKTANEIAKRQAEWAGDKYGNAYLPGASMQDCQTPKAITPPKIEKQYGPKPAEMSLWLHGLNGAAHD